MDENRKEVNRKEVLRRMLKVAKPETSKIIVGLCALLVNAVTNLAFPSIMRQAVDQAASDVVPSELAKAVIAALPASLGSLGIILVNNYFVVKAAGVFLVGSMASWLRVNYLGSAKERITAALRKDLFNSYMEKDKEFYDSCNKGDLVVALDKDTASAADVVTDVVAAGLRSLNSAVNGSIMLYLSCPSLFTVTIGILPVVAYSGMKMSKFSRSVANTLRSKQAELMSFAVERIDCISTVLLNGKEQEEKKKYEMQTCECQSLLNSAQNANGAFMAFTNIATNLSLVSILFFGGKLIRQQKLTAGALSGFAIQSVFVGLGFSGLASVYSDYVKSVDAASRVFTLMDSVSKKGASSKSFADCLPTAPTPREKYTGITFKDVCFAYNRRPSNLVLNNLSLKIAPNAITAIVGKSGAGKSTIMSIIAGMHEIQSGSILINGTELREKSRDWVRSQVGVVEQSANLLSGTIADNISYGKNNATMEEIIEAAKAADALEFINGFSDGLNTQVGVNGKLLSGGQRARIALARALIKDPPYLLLDEATGSLDRDTEAEIISTLVKLSAHKLIIAFTHSEAVMRACREIILLDQGAVKGQGRYEDLIGPTRLSSAL